MELMLPQGGQLLVAFRNDAFANPAVEASVVQLMLDATGGNDEVAAALADYAEASGFALEISENRGSRIVTLG
jgi:hypothetical protein